MLSTHVSKQYKLQQWSELIQDCKSSGLTVEDWCAENGFEKHQYYYRLRKVREAVLLASAESKQEVVAIPNALVKQEQTMKKVQATSGELKINIGDTTLHVNDSTPPSLLKMVLEVMHCAR